MKIAVPDLISNSYFPAIAAVELGKFAEHGIDASIELVFPVNKAYGALRAMAKSIAWPVRRSPRWPPSRSGTVSS
jgi:hypothetical protein